MRELRVWGVLLLPNTDFSSHFTRVSGGKCRWEACKVQGRLQGSVTGGSTVSDPYKSELCTERTTIAKGPAPSIFNGAVILICASALCNAHHLQTLYASATQKTPSAPFNDFCLMNFSVFIKGDAVTRDSLKHTHPYDLYQAPSHNHSGSAPNIAQALQNRGFAGSRLLIPS